MATNLSNSGHIEYVHLPVNRELIRWIHDDITWCMENKCPVIDCMRNPANIMDKTGPHSYGMFKGSSECMMSANIDRCMDGCIHAKKMFADHDDPDEALNVLMRDYCEDCIFSSAEED